ncbi:hypothetical protein CR513_05462, partial [Mucuna pruriens]
EVTDTWINYTLMAILFIKEDTMAFSEVPVTSKYEILIKVHQYVNKGYDQITAAIVPIEKESRWS